MPFQGLRLNLVLKVPYLSLKAISAILHGPKCQIFPRTHAPEPPRTMVMFSRLVR